MTRRPPSSRALGALLAALSVPAACDPGAEPTGTLVCAGAAGAAGRVSSGGSDGSGGTTGLEADGGAVQAGSGAMTEQGGSAGEAGATASGGDGVAGQGEAGSGTSGGGSGGRTGAGGSSSGGRSGTGGTGSGGKAAGGTSAGGSSTGNGGQVAAGGGSSTSCATSTLCKTPYTVENCGATCGEITPAACLTCETADPEAFCPFVTNGGDFGAEQAAGGPAGGTLRSTLYNEVLDCVRRTHCDAGQLADCYCGNVTAAACVAGEAAGVCKTALERGLETRDPTQLFSRYQDTLYAGGRVMFRRNNCQLITRCASVCQ